MSSLFKVVTPRNGSSERRSILPGLTALRAGRAALVALALCASLVSLDSRASDVPKQGAGLDFILGTWTGSSTCIGERAACKNEVIVYRFAPIEGHPGQVRLYGDKIVDGKRLPMGALELEADAARRIVRGGFTRMTTTGEWSFTVTGESMTGSLVILPERSVARDVKAHRASDAELPAAPPFSDYEE